jgi:hypothetical protein
MSSFKAQEFILRGYLKELSEIFEDIKIHNRELEDKNKIILKNIIMDFYKQTFKILEGDDAIFPSQT